MDASNAENQPRMPRRGEIPTGAPAVEPAKAGFAANDPRGGTVTAKDFIAANRIHIADGSFFIGPGLALHPRELDPKNEAALRAKLLDTYKFDGPSFYDDAKRAMIAAQLGTMIAPTLQAERSSLMMQINEFNTKLQNGTNPLLNEANKYRTPMQTMANELNAENGTSVNPLGMEYARNGIAFYLLLREALTRKGFLQHTADYIDYFDTPDQALNELSTKLGFNVRDMREAAAKGGLSAVGRILGIDDNTVYDITSLSQYLSQHHFSMNAIEHWHLGRVQSPEAPLEQKIANGMQARIDRDVISFRGLAKGQYDVPEPIKKEEERLAHAIETLITPTERNVLYKLGYNICFTPDRTADKIASYKGILGLNRKIANDLRDIDGNYYIYVAGQQDEKKSMRTLVHEIRHILMPTRFTPDELGQVDTLVEKDIVQLDKLDTLTGNLELKQAFARCIGAYKAGDAAQKKAIIASTNEYEPFAKLGLRVGDMLPYVNGTEQLRYLAAEAKNRLNVEGDYFFRTNYHSPSVRLREMISRYSELRDVEHREKPDMQALLGFVLPGMTAVFNNYYLPHIEKLDQELSGHHKQPTIARASGETPSRTVDASTAQHEERVHATFAALSQMGIDPSNTAHAR